MPNPQSDLERLWDVVPLVLAGLLLASAWPAGAAAAPIEELMEHIESATPALLEEAGVPGASVSLVHEGRVVYAAGFVWANREPRNADPGATFDGVQRRIDLRDGHSKLFWRVASRSEPIEVERSG